ncbi:hypothetical protein [Parapedobacter sp. 2B3]|uniref:hypothetical protein n=1 Tax=Parapedobacter sp. 2B3 TaxID=3342381 RepID=UPI0035B69394
MELFMPPAQTCMVFEKPSQNRKQFESSYASMMQEVEQEIFALSTGDAPKDKNRKELHTRFRQLELCKEHLLAKSLGSMNISSFAQETMCFVGQQLVFEEAGEVINSLTGSIVGMVIVQTE